VAELQLAFAQYALYAWLLLLVVALWTLFSISSLRRRLDILTRRYSNVTRGVDSVTLVDAVDQHLDEVRSLAQRVESLASECRLLDEKLELGLRRVGLIRYNPFDDTGGDQSFALALLDDHGDGVVITSIFGRDNSRLYAKPVKGGRSKYSLSTEEEQAISQASLAH